MTVLSIRTIPDPILRVVSNPIDLDHIEIKFWTFIDDMIETAKANDLVGLAANQVGLAKRIFIINMLAAGEKQEETSIPVTSKINKNKYNFKTFINPVVHSPYSTGSSIQLGAEGCASIPNMAGGVKRFERVEIEHWIDNSHREIDLLYGYVARIAQHEEDHLDGILFTDRTDMIWKKEELED